MGAALDVDSMATTVAQAQASKVWNSRITTCIAEANKHAAKTPEKVWRYAILPEDITAEHSPNLMTPTFKIKREGVAERYAAIIDSCGGDPAQGPPANSPAPVQAC